MAEDYQPDLILIDGRMKEMGGLEIIQRIKDQWPEIGVVVLSMYSELKYAALAAGADAFLTKGEPPEVLLHVLETVAEQKEMGGKND